MNDNRPIFVPMAIASIAIMMSTLLLSAAVVVWLAEVFGSLVIPCLLVGGFMATIALVVYLVTLRSTFKMLSVQVTTMYEISRVIQRGYEWAVALLRTSQRGGGA